MIDLGSLGGIALAERDSSETVWIAGSGVEVAYSAAMAAKANDTGVLQMMYLPEPRTPLLGGPGSEVYGATFNRASSSSSVNDVGDVVGGCDYYDPQAILREDSEHRATLWLNTIKGYQRIDLRLADDSHNYSMAADINETGTVVGTSGLIDFGNEGFESFQRAVLWRPGVGLIDLNDLLPIDSGWSLDAAIGINDLNQVSGAGHFQGVLWAYRFDLDTFEIVAVPLLPGGMQNGAYHMNLAGHVVG